MKVNDFWQQGTFTEIAQDQKSVKVYLIGKKIDFFPKKLGPHLNAESLLLSILENISNR